MTIRPEDVTVLLDALQRVATIAAPVAAATEHGWVHVLAEDEIAAVIRLTAAVQTRTLPPSDDDLDLP